MLAPVSMVTSLESSACRVSCGIHCGHFQPHLGISNNVLVSLGASQEDHVIEMFVEQ